MKKKKESLKMSNKVKKIFKAYVLGVCIFALTIGTSMNVLAADDPMSVVNNFIIDHQTHLFYCSNL